ncbi:nucleotide-binding protein [Seonamhaeicola marinus]|uniref:ParA family protein n=1 Tax=Seonamhaeicola marinus TaxID=1912246 RepID=A0A5D0HVJ2_9FLAO|nr:AAA family ATPase [Seonamhaeicola marinus]TYA74951.1 ParA family protein [Seonamhaeicola marinus]
MSESKLVSIWCPKGGQGKSLLALNLAAACIEDGKKSIVIDQDPQGTSISYYRGGNLNFKVFEQPPMQKPEETIVFVDHQASDWEVPKSKLIVMPVQPKRDQYMAYITAYKKAKEQGKEVISIVTNVVGNRPSERRIAERMRSKGAFIINSSGVFSRASEELRTIYDSKLDTAYKVNDRRQEMSELLKLVLKGKSNIQQEVKKEREELENV